VRAFIVRRNASPFDRIEPTAAQRERFEAALQEDEFRILNSGVTVVPAVKR
jgi:hypothetical protein